MEILAERDPRPLKRVYWMAGCAGVSEGVIKKLMPGISRNCKMESIALTGTSYCSQGEELSLGHADRLGSK